MELEIMEKMKTRLVNLAIVILLLFGLLTIFMAGSVILDLFGIRGKEGQYVPFVVWANLVCGLLYVMSAIAFFQLRRWAVWPLVLAVLILVITLGGLLLYINSGGLYENKTLFAMVFRTAVTLAFAYLVKKVLDTQRNGNLVLETKEKI
ncbi:MAG TPA: hypothetical protein VGD22_16445 [Sphingobacteriaceae bacterium]